MPTMVELAARVSEKNCIMCWEGRNTSCVSGWIVLASWWAICVTCWKDDLQIASTGVPKHW